MYLNKEMKFQNLTKVKLKTGDLNKNGLKKGSEKTKWNRRNN